MKVAILSMQQIKNYGSFLQAFSLKKNIESLGHTCEFINIIPGEQLEGYKYNPQIQISAESETKRSIFREKDKTKRSKKESAQHSKSRNKSFVMTSVSAL